MFILQYFCYMDNIITRFWSIIVITLSQPIIEIKRQALSRIKLRSVNKEVRKIQKMHFDSQKRTISDTHSYVSVSDIKPLSNLYSSVKIYQQDFKGSQFQTKKQKIKHVLEQSMDKVKLQDWMIARRAKIILAEDYPKSQFCTKSMSNYSEEALNSIKMYKFQDFCTSNLKKKRTLFFKEKNMMKYKNDSISDSLTHLEDTKIQISIDIFDLILYAGSQKQGTMPTVWYIWKFIQEIQQEEDDIKDEAYFQIVKQMSSNKKIYYKFLACLAATVQPSTRMYLPLLNYIYFHSLDPQSEGYEQYHNYMFFSLIKNFSNPRKAPPSLFQVFCLMNLRKVPLLIRFPRENIFFMESYSTVEQILQELIQLYGLSSNTSYLFNIEGVLLQKGMILDGLNHPKINEPEQQSLDRFISFQGFRAFLVIKNMLEMNSCQQNFLIMYNYLVNQYRSGLFAVTNKSCFQIGGLIIASEVQIQQFYEFSFAKYLPRKKYLNGVPKSKLKHVENMIINQYQKFKGTKTQARKKIIEKLSKSRAFLTHFFLCNVHIDQQQVIQAWVGLKTQSIIIVQPYTSRVILHVQYEKIRKWGKSKTELCLKIKQIGDLHIQSFTLDTLVSIFTNYLKYIAEKLKEINNKQNKEKILENQVRKNSVQIELQ